MEERGLVVGSLKSRGDNVTDAYYELSIKTAGEKNVDAYRIRPNTPFIVPYRISNASNSLVKIRSKRGVIYRTSTKHKSANNLVDLGIIESNGFTPSSTHDLVSNYRVPPDDTSLFHTFDIFLCCIILVSMALLQWTRWRLDRPPLLLTVRPTSRKYHKHRHKSKSSRRTSNKLDVIFLTDDRRFEGKITYNQGTIALIQSTTHPDAAHEQEQAPSTKRTSSDERELKKSGGVGGDEDEDFVDMLLTNNEWPSADDHQKEN